MKLKTVSRLIILFLGFAALYSCRDEEPQVTPTTLEITVIDEDVSAVEDADVSLYRSLDDWLFESNAVQSASSDSGGVVSFVGIDTGEYFIDIQKETLNNWESGAKKTVFENLVNSTNITINESKSGLLSDANGKNWILTGYLRNGVDVYPFLEDCEKDSERIFFKGPTLGSFQLSPGELICEFEDVAEEGVWQFSPDQEHIDISLPFESFRWTIELLSKDLLRYSYIDDTGFTIEEIYVSK